MPTPHISAEEGAFAEAILLPGDPLRAKHIADKFLEGAVQVTGVRNMLGFTGAYRDLPVSVMGTGMGIPSASIYITELIRDYGAKRLIRVGSCGGVAEHVGMRETILAIGASTSSDTNRARYGGWDFAATADYGLLSAAAGLSSEIRGVHIGNVHSSDLFYHPHPGQVLETLQAMGILAVEMEAAGLYGIAAQERVRALAILTVSDHLITGEETTSDEREQTFDTMVALALDTLHADQAPKG